MWLIDPKTKELSVSLTMVVTSGVLCVIGAGLEMAGVVNGTSILFEMFMAACGLYFGRRFSGSKGQTLDK